MRNINVVDAPCGAGKSSFAIQMINQNPGQRFIYCTPFLDELERIRKSTGSGRFASPEYVGFDADNKMTIYPTKLESFHELLRQGRDIAVTHTTLLNSNEKTFDLIGQRDYILLQDEPLDLVQRFDATSGVADHERQMTDKDDLKHLQMDGYIEISQEDGKVTWRRSSWGQFSELNKYCNMNRLYRLGEDKLMCVFPPEFFDLFKEVYVFDYLFKDTINCAYFRKYGIPYETMSVEKTDSGYQLADYDLEKEYEYRQSIRRLITVYGGEGRYPRRCLCKNWFKSTTTKEIEKLSARMGYFFRFLAQVKAKDAMWSCPVLYMDIMKTPGYVRTRGLNKEEKRLSEKEQEERKKELRTFVPCNARATNVYKDRSALAYCYNLYPPTEIETFFLSGENKSLFDRDGYAKQALIQWIFRSRIREGQPINLYLPSARMEKLFNEFFDELARPVLDAAS